MMRIRPGATLQIGQIRVSAMEQLEITCSQGRSGLCCYASLKPVSISVLAPGTDRKFQIPSR